MTASFRPSPLLRVSLGLVWLFLLSEPSRAAALSGSSNTSGSPAGKVGGIAEGPMDRQATSTNGITLGRPIQWSISGSFLDLQAANICNDGSSYNPTANLRLELWASSQPFNGTGTFSGYKLGQSAALGGLSSGQCYVNYDSGAVPLMTTPPDGIYYVVMFLDMFTNSSVDDGYAYVDFGQFPTTITVSGGVITATTGGCTSNVTTLCIDDAPGDHRFQIQATFHTTQGSVSSGNGTPVSLSSLGVNQGGLFWFFSANNPELLIKVLNGCAANSRHWVFASGGTNVGVTLSVTDTRTGQQKVYSNPDLNAFPTIQDTAAFPCPFGAN